MLAPILIVTGLVTASSFDPSVEILFLSCGGVRPAVITARFSALPEGDGVSRYRYRVGGWVGRPDERGRTISGSSDESDLVVAEATTFQNPTPIEGWPDRNTMSLAWNDDGRFALEAGTAPRIRLSIEPWQAKNAGYLPGDDWTCRPRAAVLEVGKWKLTGQALVYVGRGSTPGRTEATGALLVLLEGQPGPVLHTPNRGWRAIDPSPPKPALPTAVRWLDILSLDGHIVPAVVRLTAPKASILLSAVPARLQRSDPGAAAILSRQPMVPVVGEGVANDRVFQAVGLLVPYPR